MGGGVTSALTALLPAVMFVAGPTPVVLGAKARQGLAQVTRSHLQVVVVAELRHLQQICVIVHQSFSGGRSITQNLGHDLITVLVLHDHSLKVTKY